VCDIKVNKSGKLRQTNESVRTGTLGVLVAPAVLPPVGLHGLGGTPAAKTAGATSG
jgi:hypothetical protein